MKCALEARVAAIDVGEVALRVQLREDAMAAIQVHQRVAMAPLLAAQLRVFARRFGRQQQSRRSTAIFCARSKCSSAADSSPISRATVPKCFSISPRPIASCVCDDSDERELARAARRDEVAAHDLELGAIDLDQDARRNVAERVGDLHRLVERAGGVVPALEVRAQHAHVVQRAEHFLRRAERAELGETRSIVAKRLLVVAANRAR